MEVVTHAHSRTLAKENRYASYVDAHSGTEGHRGVRRFFQARRPPAALLPLTQVRPSDREAGVRARILARLARLPLSVPPAVVLRQGFWLAYLAHNAAQRLWFEFAQAPDTAHAEPLHRLLAEQPVPMAQIIRLRDALALHVEGPWLKQTSLTGRQPPFYAVHPAFGDEATMQLLAGVVTSRLGVRPGGLDGALRAVWSSALSEQALARYASAGAPTALSLLVQAIPELDSAGVLLTRAPENASALLAQAVWGLAEPLTTGKVRPDCWLLARSGRQVLGHEPGERQTALWPTAEGPVERSLGNGAAPPAPLDEQRLDELRRLGLHVERVLGAPQELEWVHDGARFWIVQSRPIAGLRSMINRTARSYVT